MTELTQSLEDLLSRGGPLMWMVAAGTAFGISFVLKLGLKAVNLRLKVLAERTTGKWDDILVDGMDGIRGWVIFFWLLYPLVHSFETNERALKVLSVLTTVATLIQVAIWGFRALGIWHKELLRRKAGTDMSSVAALGLVNTAIQAMFVITLVLIGLSNMGIDIAALLAGLGVGGIAVALAAQNVLGDLLASLSIVLDKPFVVGDAITVGSETGIVENIGIKTTRVRSTSGEELIFSNKDLLESRIRNFKRMWERRLVIAFGVTYSTPAAKLEQIPAWVKVLVENDGKLRFDRCYLIRYGASSLDYELVVFVKDSDLNVSLDCQQRLMLEILRKFESEKVEFAFPTQTLLFGPGSAEHISRNGLDKTN